MLIRISLIVAIIAGLAVAAVNFVVIKETITTLRKDLKDQTDARTKAEGDARKAKAELEATNAVLTATITELETTKTDLGKAIAEAENQSKAAAKFADDLKLTKEQLEAAQTKLAQYDASGLSPEQALGAAKTIKGLEDMVAEGNIIISNKNKQITKLESQLAVFVDPKSRPIELPPTAEGRILISDPKWNFVVINVGEDQGVLEKSELLVSRNGKLVGKLRVSSVQKDRAIANLMPGWSQGEIMEGDLVIPAYPKS